MFIGVTPFLKANPTPDDYNEEHLVEIGSTFFGPQPGYSLPLAIRVTNIPAQRFYNGLIVDWQVTGVGCRPKPVSGTGKVTLGGDRVRFEEVAEPPSPGEQGNEGELRVSREGIHAFVGGRWRTARYTDG